MRLNKFYLGSLAGSIALFHYASMADSSIEQPTAALTPCVPVLNDGVQILPDSIVRDPTPAPMLIKMDINAPQPSADSACVTYAAAGTAHKLNIPTPWLESGGSYESAGYAQPLSDDARANIDSFVRKVIAATSLRI
jgi:hypothetical protein